MDFMKNFILVLCLIFLFGCFKFNAQQSSSVKLDTKNIKIDKQTHQVIILGGGIGGYTTGIYLARANKNPIIIEGKTAGGTITKADIVKNWPGETEIGGKALALKIKDQVIKNNIKILEEEVIDVNFASWPYIIKTKNIITNESNEYKALSVVIAMGSTQKFLNIPGEKEYYGKGVSGCALCDGPLYKNKTVAVVGGSDSAVSESAYLSGIAKKVFIIIKKDNLTTKSKMSHEILAKSNIELIKNSTIKEIKGDKEKITELVLENTKEKTEKILKIDGLFLAIGSNPNTNIFENKLELDSNKYIIVNKNFETSIEGVFAIGDIADSKYRQAITAAGDGCKAAINVQEFLEELGLEQPSESNFDQSKKTEAYKSETKSKIENKVLEISTKSDYKAVVSESTIPVLVDFYATWCMPCQLMHPIIEELSHIFAGKVKFVKINIDKGSELALENGVMGVPTFILTKNGKVLEKFTGATDFKTLEHLINKTFFSK